MKPVSVLLTCDIHTHVQSPAQVDVDLSCAREVLRERKWPCTFMFPSTSARLLKHQVRALREEGHEIGCHGVTHEPTENFSLLPLEAQRALLRQATDEIADITGERPVSFRAPAFRVCGHTMEALDELGYEGDLSVTAGRLSIFGSDIYNWRPLFAGRRPYHPSIRNPYRSGTAKLWEIPVSAFVVPFLSNMERLAGLSFMKSLFRALYLESRVTGKPIVFVFHAEDLNAAGGVEHVGVLSWKHFIPNRTHGLELRFFLFERNWARVCRDLVALIRYMEGFQGVHFVTARAYLDALDPAPARISPRA